MKLLYIDLDGVVADFVSAMNTHPLRHTPPYHEAPDTIPGIFKNLKPLKDAISSVNKLLSSNKYEVYFLSTAPWNNTSAWTDKRIWLEEQFGDKINPNLTTQAMQQSDMAGKSQNEVKLLIDLDELQGSLWNSVTDINQMVGILADYRKKNNL